MKTKWDAIREKLLAIERRAAKARHLPEAEEKELRKNTLLIGSIFNELWAILNTTDEKGKEWHWWE